jgi:plasmid maintenance system antidote protein VapI
MPILDRKRWKRGRWATEAGVGKNCVYDYLAGKRNLTDDNRDAMAEALGLKPEELPE